MEKEDFVLGKLTLLEELARIPNKERRGRYKCFCGKEFETDIRSVTRSRTKSCGCYQSHWATKNKKPGSDGRTKTRLYKIFIGMRNRCYNPKNRSYHKYGALGIDVSKEWDNFLIFKEWSLNNGYQEDLTLDRIDGTKGYSPDNCRWATPQEQSRNTKKHKNASSKYKGVSFAKDNKKHWVAEITVNYKRIRLGSFYTEEEAARAYIEKAIELFGEFANYVPIDSPNSDNS